MRWDPITELLNKHLSPELIFAGIIFLIFILFATVFSKDLRLSIYILLVVVVLTTVENSVVHMACYILRWIILALLTTRLISSNIDFKISFSTILFFLLCIIAFVSAFSAPSISRGIVFSIVYFLCFISFFLLLSRELDSEETIYKWLKLFTMLGLTFFIFAFIFFLMNPGSYARLEKAGRFSAMFSSPGTLARILLIGGPLFLWRGLITIEKPIKQMFFFSLVLITSLLLLLAGSRAGLGVWVLTIGLFSFRYRKKMAILIIPMILVAGLYVVPKVMSSSSSQFVRHITSTEDPLRPMLRSIGFDRFRERPFTGWGVGSLSDMTSDVCPGFVSFHNSYLNYLVEMGLPGSVVIMTLLVYSYFRAWRLALFSATNEFIKDIAWFIVVSFSGLFFWNIFSGESSNPADIQFYWQIILVVFTESIVQINQKTSHDFQLVEISE